MTGIRRLLALGREALASTISSPISAVVTLVVVAAMCAIVLLTTGRTVGAEQAVIDSIDSAGTRAIVVRAQGGAGLTSDVLTRLATIDGIESAVAFGQAYDVTNSSIPDGNRVAARKVYGGDLETLGMTIASPVPSAWASGDALSRLGMRGGIGSVTTSLGEDYAVAGELRVPSWLVFLAPVVLIPDTEPEQPVTVLVVIAERPDLVAPVASAVQAVLAVDDPSQVTVTTSEELAQLRALVQGQLGSFGRGLVILVFAVSGILVAAILTGLVIQRRKDFGRRRALGATRALVVGILLVQSLLLASMGALVGVAVALVVLLAGDDPLPGAAFTAAVAFLAVMVSVVAAVVPALIAARRDPLKELRVP
ncbi:ABC transporter permease [Protaetiibacter intestinalis]|uniref:FtsX-like permease family protein n=1 Tax=Protaetiibacter intestinalis TaxID=2419774 RepID=A0A387B820_9MICO|nr:FtsX-like permease family protein [Protaetiibacter intestinalis]AYF98493.1 FtsX-like permease family protein [Protaetiibacter intestinalis]